MPHGCVWSSIIWMVVARTVLRELVLSPVVRPMESRRIGDAWLAWSSSGWMFTTETTATAPPPTNTASAPTAMAWCALPSRNSRNR